MSTEDPKARRERILGIVAQYGARNVRVFGSVARGDAGPDSDVDFLVEMDEDRSLPDHVGLVQNLEDYLGRKVDVVSERALHRFIRDRVLAEAAPLRKTTVRQARP